MRHVYYTVYIVGKLRANMNFIHDIFLAQLILIATYIKWNLKNVFFLLVVLIFTEYFKLASTIPLGRFWKV